VSRAAARFGLISDRCSSSHRKRRKAERLRVFCEVVHALGVRLDPHYHQSDARRGARSWGGEAEVALRWWR
jgi:hypothetical protein